MKHFIKLNMVSILYALMILVPIELMANVYRISRLTGWNIGTVSRLSSVTIVVVSIFGTILLFYLTKKWLKSRKANFWTVILWIPYFVLFSYIIASQFPTTYGGDAPNPVTGLLAIGALIIFPIYILIINFIGYENDDKAMTTG
ncbi:hypothetical protein [Neobacillus massiliamazoniensis]|uniref:Uncharacterized protein n=1 Tax=Neobacillus massiliamazoniensis TaxID=1499688 RepID=A0A0U1P3P3_9BACI|nr:hypothetical protein [Neobacillus massiliamazoniensis]CRK84743.1 hypothetical protein BN000_04793 [Neobacillus massiliamazoniensis]